MDKEIADKLTLEINTDLDKTVRVIMEGMKKDPRPGIKFAHAGVPSSLTFNEAVHNVTGEKVEGFIIVRPDNGVRLIDEATATALSRCAITGLLDVEALETALGIYTKETGRTDLCTTIKETRDKPFGDTNNMAEVVDTILGRLGTIDLDV